MIPSLLQVKNLKKYFPVLSGLFRKQIGFTKAVDDVSFTVEKGEVLGMVGESGSGKSTAARTAIRLIEPTGGDSLFNGISLFSLNDSELKKIRKNIQIVFQDPLSSLNPRKNIRENIGEAVLFHRIVEAGASLEEYVEYILQQVGLSPDVMNRYPHEFSGGQQQRICIGRAIALKPELIVCDEAVSALDVSIQAQILNLLSELKDSLNLSYLFISHDLSVVRYISDRITVLLEGKIVETRSAEALFEDPRHPYTRRLLSSIPRLHRKKSKIFIPKCIDRSN